MRWVFWHQLPWKEVTQKPVTQTMEYMLLCNEKNGLLSMSKCLVEKVSCGQKNLPFHGATQWERSWIGKGQLSAAIYMFHISILASAASIWGYSKTTLHKSMFFCKLKQVSFDCLLPGWKSQLLSLHETIEWESSTHLVPILKINDQGCQRKVAGRDKQTFVQQISKKTSGSISQSWSLHLSSLVRSWYRR